MFSAELQRDSEHTLEIDSNGEIVLTCTETGRFIKFPGTSTVESMKAQMEAHRVANVGQVTLTSIEAKKSELLAGLKPGE